MTGVGKAGSERDSHRRRVCWVLGTGYCGSSLLNLLLDSQPRIRGLGEAINLVDPIGRRYCSSCVIPVQECPLFGAVDDGRFYGSIFDYYDDADVLIDTSKDWKLSVTAHPLEDDVDYRLIVLSKSPHEYAYSLCGHNSTMNVQDGFTLWLNAYPSILRHGSQFDRLGPDRVMTQTYQDLAADTAGSIDRLCDFLMTDSNWDNSTQWWNSDSHIVGGNNAVFAQITSKEWFAESDEYLNGKYQDRRHQVFVDEAWKSDSEFVEACRRLYSEMSTELDPVLKNLGHGSTEQYLMLLNSL